METGELIALYRKQAGMTIDELAEKSGVPKGTLNKIIGGVTKAPTLDNMKVIAFVGPSGSGKSYRATWVAQKAGIDYLIDDGLLIRGNELLAGCSAKKESTKIGSIRRALFRDVRHAEEVRRAIRRWQPEKIMLLGTSDGMVEEIAKTLHLSVYTVKKYISHLKDMTGYRNRTELAVAASRLGLVTPGY